MKISKRTLLTVTICLSLVLVSLGILIIQKDVSPPENQPYCFPVMSLIASPVLVSLGLAMAINFAIWLKVTIRLLTTFIITLAIFLFVFLLYATSVWGSNMFLLLMQFLGGIQFLIVFGLISTLRVIFKKIYNVV